MLKALGWAVLATAGVLAAFGLLFGILALMINYLGWLTWPVLFTLLVFAWFFLTFLDKAEDEEDLIAD